MKFFDERIEQTKGKICRNAILLSTLLSLSAGGLRIANILRNAAPLYLWRASLELLIGAGGMVCLLVALIAYLRRPKDERADTEMGQLYNRMATLLLKISLCGYAVLIPVVQYLGTPMNFADSAFDSILFLLFFVIGTYVIFAFRKHDIYFNYSLMEEQHYARAVLKNMGKLLLFLAILTCLSDTSAFLVMLFANARPGFLWSYTLQLLIQFFVWGFVLSLLYALLSFLERVSYQSGRLLSPATLITLGITVLIYSLYATLVVLVDRSGLTQSQAAILVSYANFLKYPIRLSLLLFLSYFGYEYQKHTPNRLLNGACTLMAVGEAISVASAGIVSVIGSGKI